MLSKTVNHKFKFKVTGIASEAKSFLKKVKYEKIMPEEIYSDILFEVMGNDLGEKGMIDAIETIGDYEFSTEKTGLYLEFKLKLKLGFTPINLPFILFWLPTLKLSESSLKKSYLDEVAKKTSDRINVLSLLSMSVQK